MFDLSLRKWNKRAASGDHSIRLSFGNSERPHEGGRIKTREAIFSRTLETSRGLKFLSLCLENCTKKIFNEILSWDVKKFQFPSFHGETWPRPPSPRFVHQNISLLWRKINPKSGCFASFFPQRLPDQNVFDLWLKSWIHLISTWNVQEWGILGFLSSLPFCVLFQIFLQAHVHPQKALFISAKEKHQRLFFLNVRAFFWPWMTMSDFGHFGASRANSMFAGLTNVVGFPTSQAIANLCAIRGH